MEQVVSKAGSAYFSTLNMGATCSSETYFQRDYTALYPRINNSSEFGLLGLVFYPEDGFNMFLLDVRKLYQIRRCHISDDSSLHGHVQENLKSTMSMWCVTATCTRSVRRRVTHLQHRHVATARWWKKRKLVPPTIGAAGRYVKGSNREHPKLQWVGCFILTSTPQDYPSRRPSEASQSNSNGLRHARSQWQAQP
jgi:hypothetical protein